MRRVTNRDWTEEKPIWQSRPLTLAADLEGRHTQYMRASRVRSRWSAANTC